MGRICTFSPLALTAILICSTITVGCKDTGGKVEGSVTGGILDTGSKELSYNWKFGTSGDYAFDSNYVQVSGNKASLKEVNSTFNNSASFNGGNHVGTEFSSGVLKMNQGLGSNTSASTLLSSISSRLKVYAKLDGNFTDSSGNSASISNSGVTFGVGKLGQGGYFNGSSTCLTLGTAPTSTTQSFSFWTYPVVNTGSAARFYSAASDNFLLYLRDDGRIQIQWKGGSTIAEWKSLTSDPILFSTWNHIVVTVDVSNYTNAVATYYLNGQPKALTLTATPVGSASVITGSAGIGCYLSSHARDFNGIIDDFAIWEGILTASEAKTLYDGQSFQHSGDIGLSSSWTPKWSNLVGYWKMDGNWRDSTGNFAQGVGTNSPTFSTSSKVGSSSGSFTASSSQSVSLGDVTQLNGTSNFTIVGWCRFTTLVDNMKCISKYSGANDRISVGLSQAGAGSNDDLSLVLSNSSLAYGYTNSGLIKAGIWYHIALVFDGSKSSNAERMILYVDGKQKTLSFVGTVPSTTSTSLAGTPLTLSRPSAGEYMNGLIDDVGIFNTSLLASEITLIYNRQKQRYSGSYNSPIIDMGAPGAPWTSINSTSALPFYKELTGAAGSESSASYSATGGSLMNGLIGLWHFNETTGTTLADSSSNSLNLTLQSGVTLGAEGILSNAATFGGASGSLYINNNSQMKPSFPFTMSSWVYLHANGRMNPIIASDTWDTGANYCGAVMQVLASNSVTVEMGTCGGVGATHRRTFASTTTLSTGRWYHVVGVFNSLTSANIYIDGKLETVTPSGTGGSMTYSSAASTVGYTPGNYFSGKIDELAYWSRALTASEVLEVYRRGANRVKYQVRSCANADCSDATFIGPDGTGTSYFSELQNNTAVDSSGNPTGSVRTSAMNLDWSASGALSNITGKAPNNRYFQFKVYMETDDENNLCSSAPCMPEISSVSVGPLGRYWGGSPSIVNQSALSISSLQEMTRSDSGSCTTYQVSVDEGANWKWWNGSAWTSTASGVATSNYLSDFTLSRLQELGGGKFKFKAFLNTNSSGDFTQSCNLENVGVTYQP